MAHSAHLSLPGRRRGALALIWALSILVALPPVVSGPAAASEGATVSGRVIAPSGDPVAGTAVTAFPDQGGDEVASVVAGDDGRYALTVPAGSYRLSFSDPDAAYFGQWYPAATSAEAATTLTITTGTRDLGDTTLWPRDVSGKVVDTHGVDFTGVTIWLLNADGSRRSRSYADKEGGFTFRGLPAGDYVLELTEIDTAPGAAVVTRKPVSVGVGIDSSAVSAVVPRAAWVTGTVSPAPGDTGYVEVLGRWRTPDGFDERRTVVEADGSYRLTGLPADGVKILVKDGDASSALQWYGGASTFREAATVPTEAGTVTTDIDVALRPAASVAGRVTDQAGAGLDAMVVAYPSSSDEEPVRMVDVRDGEYAMRGLPAGDYRIAFRPIDNFVPEWSGDASTFADAATVHVAEGQDLTGVDAVLAVGASLSGSLTPSSASDAELEAHPASGGPRVGRSGQPGHLVDQLPAGTFRLHVPQDRYIAEQWLPGTVTLTAGQQATGYSATVITCPTRPRVEEPSGFSVPAIGRKLVASPGVWSSTPDATRYQWLREGTPIEGATNEDYVPTEQDRGRRLGVEVTAAFGSREATCTSAPSAAVAEALASTSPPVISGRPHIGKTLTVTEGGWESAPSSVRYEWLVDGVSHGFTGPTFEVPEYIGNSYVAGKHVSVRVVASSPVFAEGVAQSADVTLLGDPLAGGQHALRGRAQEGKRMWVANVAPWSPAAERLRYRWLRAGKPIRGATSRRYIVRRADIGRRLSVRVIAVRSGYRPGVATTPRSRRVAPASSIALAARSPRRGVVVLRAKVVVTRVKDPRGCVYFRGPRVSRCRDMRFGVARVVLRRVPSGVRRYTAAYRGWGGMTRVVARTRLRVR